jgi:hypothetical protein
MLKRFSIAFAGLLLLLTVAACAADGPPANGRVNPDALIYTFFPVTMLQAFVGISDDQAAKISVIDTKLKFNAKRSAVQDGVEIGTLRSQANGDVRAVLLPDQVEKLANCAFEIQIFTNTFGRNKVESLTLTPSQMLQIRPIMATAVVRYMKISQESDQEVNAISPQTSEADTLSRVNQIQQECDQKRQAMRAVVKTGIEPLFTDAQRAVLGISPSAAATK